MELWREPVNYTCALSPPTRSGIHTERQGESHSFNRYLLHLNYGPGHQEEHWQ